MHRLFLLLLAASSQSLGDAATTTPNPMNGLLDSLDDLGYGKAASTSSSQNYMTGSNASSPCARTVRNNQNPSLPLQKKKKKEQEY